MTNDPDSERRVEFFDDGLEVFPDTTRDEHGPGWGEAVPGPSSDADDDLARFLEDRPPHWG